MTARARGLIGVATTAVLLVIGVSQLLEGSTVLGGVLIGLAALRAVYAGLQLRQAYFPAHDDE